MASPIDADAEARFRSIFRRIHADHPNCLRDEWVNEPCRLSGGRPVARPRVWSRRNGPWQPSQVLWRVFQLERLGQLLHDDSEEMRLLRVAVQRVIGRTRYQQRQWARAGGLPQLAGKSETLTRRGEQDRVDWEDLWENVVSTLASSEKQVLELRKQGKTFTEIGSELGMPRQRACETYHNAVARLQKSYPEW